MSFMIKIALTGCLCLLFVFIPPAMSADFYPDNCVAASTIGVSEDESVILVGVLYSGFWLSRDGGITWNPLNDEMNAGYPAYTRKTLIVDANADSMMAVFRSSPDRNDIQIAITNDGGLSWNPIEGDMINANSDNNITFNNNNHNSLYYHSLTTVSTSEDYGNTWDRIDLPIGYIMGSLYSFFYDQQDNALFATGSGYIDPANHDNTIVRLFMKSFDEGQTWQNIINLDSLEAHNMNMTFLARDMVRLSNGDLLFALNEWRRHYCEDRQLMRSSDNGETWSWYNGNLPSWYRPTDFEEDPTYPGTVYVIGEYKYGLYRSLDYGQTFSRITNGLPEGPTIMSEVSSNQFNGKVYVSIKGYGVYSTDDGGESWASIPMPPIGTLSDFTVTPEYIYVRSDDYHHTRFDFETSSWSDLEVPLAQDTVTMINPIEYVCGDTLVTGAWKRPYAVHLDYYNFLRSYDSGETWSPVGPMVSPPPDCYPTMYNGENVNRIIVVPYVNGGFRTEVSIDHAESWIICEDVPDGIANALFVQTDSVIYTITGNAGLYTSHNNGASWEFHSLPDRSIMSGFLHNGELYLLDHQENDWYGLYRYIDGEAELIHPSLFEYREPIASVPGNPGYICYLSSLNRDYEPLLYISNDNGETFYTKRLDFGPYNQYRNNSDIAYDPVRDVIWIATGVGLVSVSTSDLATPEGEIRPLPIDHGILSAYPNPFNHWSRITFDLPESGQVSLKLFDIQGRLVQTLINETRDKGRHYINLMGKDLASGTYFLRLEGPGTSLVRKVVLVK